MRVAAGWLRSGWPDLGGRVPLLALPSSGDGRSDVELQKGINEAGRQGVRTGFGVGGEEEETGEDRSSQ